MQCFSLLIFGIFWSLTCENDSLFVDLKNSASIGSEAISYQTDNITVSAGDYRSYRYLELKNALRILIVSDPNATESAVSLDINAGSMNDPRDLQGLSNLLAYVLPLQNQKYRKLDEFSKFVRSKGGVESCSVRTDHTIYRMQMSNSSFFTALDMFANMFMSPIFSPFFVGPQIRQLDLVFQRMKNYDFYVLKRLVSLLANQSHDYSKFDAGNLESLEKSAKSNNLSLSSELARFYRTFYSANLMTLAVYARGDLDTLAGKIAALFGNLPKRRTEPPSWPQSPFNNRHMGYRLNVASDEETSLLYVFFPVPEFRAYYRSKPDYYVGYLLGREGEGSLTQYLKMKDYVTDVKAQVPAMPKGFQMIAFSITLTKTGLMHIEDLLVSMFQYIKMLDKVGPKLYFHKRLENLRMGHFEHQIPSSKPIHYAAQMSHNMHKYEVEDIVSGDYLLTDFDPNLIKTLMTWLNSENFNFILFSKEFKGKTDKKEHWFGTNYSLEQIPNRLKKLLKNSNQNPFFRFPVFY